MIKGLYFQLSEMLLQIEELKRQAIAYDHLPATAHQCEQQARQFAIGAGKVSGQIRSNEADIDRIEELIAAMKIPVRTPDRTLAIRELENASGRLRRELGDKPV